MKKKETLWQLLKRLDEEAGQFNFHLNQANRYFDTASSKTKKILESHEKKLHTTISKVQKSLREYMNKKNEKKV